MSFSLALFYPTPLYPPSPQKLMSSFSHIQLSFDKKEEQKIKDVEIEKFGEDTIDKLDQQILFAKGIYKERLKQRKQDIIDDLPVL